MNVAIAANEKFFPGLWAAVLSCISAASETHKLKIFVIDCGLQKSSWSKLARMVERFPSPPELIRTDFPVDRLSGLHLPEGKSPLTYARLFYPEVFDCDKLLHIDADMLVFRDILKLREVDIERRAGAAARNQDGDTLQFDLPADACFEKGLNPNSSYFNAGLFWMNLAHWRRESFTERCLEFMREWNPTYVDQTTINAVMNDQIVELAPEWNRLINRIDPQALVNPNCVVHYTNDKPWLVKQHTPASTLFEKFCRDTGLDWVEPQDVATIWDQFEYLNLPRGLAYRLLGTWQSICGNQDRANAYSDAGKYWMKWFADRKTRKADYTEAKRCILANNYAPDWLN